MFLAIYAVYGLHIIAHHYFDIDESIVFDVVKNKLPGMLETINKMIDESKAKNRLYGDLCKRIRNVQIQSADTLTFFSNVFLTILTVYFSNTSTYVTSARTSTTCTFPIHCCFVAVFGIASISCSITCTASACSATATAWSI